MWAIMRAPLIAICLFCTAPLQAQNLFDDDGVIEITLRGPLSTVFDDTSDRSERDFVLEFSGREFPVEVRLRGNSRLRVCQFPPLRLDFHKKQVQGSIFDGQDKLKLVTHCRNSDRGEQDLLEEYAAYRILNVLTDLSYRVRLLRIHYEDTDGKLSKRASPRYGFVIEPAELLAARTAMEAVTVPAVPLKRHDLDQAALVYVYQYLIANTDWGLVKADYDDGCCHNVDLFERDSVLVTIPYDFDLSGLVNASYAFPDRTLHIRRVTQRRYRGVCTDRAVLEAAIAKVAGHRTEILAAVGDIPGLDDKSREKTTEFLYQFFNEAADREKLVDNFEKHCIG